MKDLSSLIKPYLLSKKNLFVALSGGIDSIVLLNEINKQKRKKNLLLTAIHVNHNIHPDSKKWMEFCEDFCKRNQIKFLSKTLKKTKKKEASLENSFRKARYKFFEENLHDGILFMGHHLDDQIETFFLRILRGAGIQGLKSIPKERLLGNGKLVRPFLGVSKEDLIFQAKKDKLKYIKDPSNKENHFDRNYLRNKLLPLLEKRWPSYRGNVNQLISNLIEADSILTQTTISDFKKVRLNEKKISLIELNKLDEARQKNVVFYWVENLKLKKPSSKVINLFFSKFLKDNKTPNSKFIWGAKKKQGSVCIEKNKKELRISDYSS